MAANEFIIFIIFTVTINIFMQLIAWKIAAEIIRKAEIKKAYNEANHETNTGAAKSSSEI